jgi:uncharacterized protein
LRPVTCSHSIKALHYIGNVETQDRYLLRAPPGFKYVLGIIMTLKDKIDIAEVKRFVDECGPNTKLYIGCDSERLKFKKEWYADYTLAVVIHIDGRHGCKIFGAVSRERDYDQRKDRPAMRLMNEVYKVSDLYLQLAEQIVEYDIEVHLDINPKEEHGSSCVVSQAIGYIKGTCNVTPLVKPKAFAASYAADRLKEVLAA